MEIKIPYYEDNTRLSNSAIGWFLNKGPSYFHKMLSGQGEEERSLSLMKGTMIHEYLLQPEEFQKDYVVWDKRRPSSGQEELFCQALADSIEIEPNKSLLNAYKQAYVVTNKSDDKVLLEATKKASTLKEYIDFLKSKDQRIMIRPYDVTFLQKIKQNIDDHKAASKLLQPVDNKNIFHEFHINWDYDAKTNGQLDFTCKCKSLLDSVTFSFTEKKIILMDLKTTIHLHKFEDAVNTYDYTRQLYFYTKALCWYIENELHEKWSDWRFEWYIIAIDNTEGSVRVFTFNYDQVFNPNVDKVRNAIQDIVWHQSNGLWEHSRAYYEGNGIEILKL